MRSQRDSWLDSDVEQLAPNTFRVPLAVPDPALKGVNVYFLISRSGVVMIDGGWALAHNVPHLEAISRSLGFSLADVSTILVTHMHHDHYTQAIAIRRSHGVPVAIGVGERASIKAARSITATASIRQLDILGRAGAASLSEAMRREKASASMANGAYYEDPDQWLHGGTVIDLDDRKLEVVATPGHTNGHLVFRDPDAGIAFTGDHILPYTTPSVGHEPIPVDSPLQNYLDSLRLMVSMSDAVLAPAHGPVASSVHARTAEIIDHHDARLAEIMAAVTGRSSCYDIACRVGWTRRMHALTDLTTADQVLALAETFAHLTVLERRGRLSRSDADGISYYDAVREPQ